MSLHTDVLEIAARLKRTARDKADQPAQLAATMEDMADRLADLIIADMGAGTEPVNDNPSKGN